MTSTMALVGVSGFHRDEQGKIINTEAMQTYGGKTCDSMIESPNRLARERLLPLSCRNHRSLVDELDRGRIDSHVFLNSDGFIVINQDILNQTSNEFRKENLVIKCDPELTSESKGSSETNNHDGIEKYGHSLKQVREFRFRPIHTEKEALCVAPSIPHSVTIASQNFNRHSCVSTISSKGVNHNHLNQNVKVYSRMKPLSNPIKDAINTRHDEKISCHDMNFSNNCDGCSVSSVSLTGNLCHIGRVWTKFKGTGTSSNKSLSTSRTANSSFISSIFDDDDDCIECMIMSCVDAFDALACDDVKNKEAHNNDTDMVDDGEESTVYDYTAFGESRSCR